MKKITALLMLLLSAALLVIPTYATEGEIVDLYPYDDPKALLGPSTIHTLVGDSNWDVIFGGVRYHVPRGGVRYAKDFEDKNANGYIGAAEMGALSWNAFASVIINDTDEQKILETANLRTDLTSVVHRIYSYFDENGKLEMVEDHINTYAIINDGTAEATDYRLATEAEIAADAAEEDVTKKLTKLSHIRMKVDAEDTDGYVLEPLGYITWVNPELASLPAAEQSLIVDENPNYVTIDAGHTVWSFGTNDRGSQNAKTTAFIKTLPARLAAQTDAPIKFEYTTLAPEFAGVTAMDKDLVTAGINNVVEYNGTFTLPENLSASYVKMFDENGKIINQVTKVPFTVDIMKEDVVLETISYAYDVDADKYTPSAQVTKVDTSVFGAGYKAIFKAQNPLNIVKEVEVDVVIGVMPPKFKDVTNRFHKEDVFVDLLGKITADDGYGNDKTSDITIKYPESLNPYYPQPGQYKIDLEFVHHVFIPGTPSYPVRVTVGTTVLDVENINKKLTAFHGQVNLWTDATTLKTMTFDWTNSGVFVEVGANGKVIRTIDRTNWDIVDAAGSRPAGASDMFAGWLTDLVIEEGGYVLLVGRSNANRALAKAITYDQALVKADAVVGIDDFHHDIVTKASYNLTVTDHTAPQLLVVQENLVVTADDFASAEEAILSNVIAFDNADDDLAIFVSNDGGMVNLTRAGSYNVSVDAEDANGNSSSVSFTVVVEVEVENASVDQLNSEIADLLGKINELESSTLTEAEIKSMIEQAIANQPVEEKPASVGVVATVGISLGAALASFGGAFLLFRKK